MVIFVRSLVGPLPISRVPGQFPQACGRRYVKYDAPNNPGVFIRPESSYTPASREGPGGLK